MKPNLVRRLLATLTITTTIGSAMTAKFFFDKSLDIQDEIKYNHDRIQSTLLEYAQTEEFQHIYTNAIDVLTDQYVNGAINYEEYSSKMMEIHSSSFIRNAIDDNNSDLSQILRDLDDKCNNSGVNFTYYMIGFSCFVMATTTIPFASFCLLKDNNEEINENIDKTQN
ncbi:MAG: hypothetical protein IKC49_03730 [Clostridia bacterium]|nr:hypothetical protein [Clostridia bacterium]